MKKNIIFGMSILVAGIALQSVAHAQGLPMVGGSVDFSTEIAQIRNLQSQLDGLQQILGLTIMSKDELSAPTSVRDPAISAASSTNALLVQILAVQQQTLSELESIDQRLAVSDAIEQQRGNASDDRLTAAIASENHTHVMH